MQTCTRCLKAFNPAWRPTPASDPSSEATCAVRHPYPDFASGLVVSLPARKRNNYKTTWRWRCCGREIQSASDEPLLWPRKEDDKTGGWCFVGKHTTEAGVREKFGLKPGKGKTIDEIADISDTAANMRKKMKLADDSGAAADANGNAMAAPPTPSSTMARTGAAEQTQIQQHPQQWPQGALAHNQNPPPSQQAPPPEPSPMRSEPTPPEEPVKRKRGRPKGSKSKNKLLGQGLPPAAGTSSSAAAAQTSPESQLLTEASQKQHTGDMHGSAAGNNHLWTLYGDPNMVDLADGDAEHEEDDVQHVDTLGMSQAELGMLVHATAAMGGQSANMTPQPSTESATPAKRGRGRPKGVKNGAGKAALEKRRLEEEAVRQQQQQQQLQHQHQHRQEENDLQSDPVVVPAGAGGGWFPGDDPPWNSIL